MHGVPDHVHSSRQHRCGDGICYCSGVDHSLLPLPLALVLLGPVAAVADSENKCNCTEDRQDDEHDLVRGEGRRGAEGEAGRARGTVLPVPIPIAPATAAATSSSAARGCRHSILARSAGLRGRSLTQSLRRVGAVGAAGGSLHARVAHSRAARAGETVRADARGRRRRRGRATRRRTERGLGWPHGWSAGGGSR